MRRLGESERRPHETDCAFGAHPVDALMNEHQTILAVLAAMDQEADKLAAGGRLRQRFWLSAAEFVRSFAERCHHGKEEDVLFPALVECGLSREVGPIADRTSEHADARNLTRSLVGAARDRDAERLLAAARAYTELLREHIAEENDVLFEVAREVLPSDHVRRLISGFAEVEKAVAGDAAHKYVDLARRLCADTGVSFDASI
jgi:hemerythrin-like domain-containing protein